MHQHAKFRQNRSICCEDIKIFQFLARDVIYISRLCYDVSVRLCVRLSVMEVHWRIIATCNLGFKSRSHFTAHCGRRAACRRIMLASASFLVQEGGRPPSWIGLGHTWTTHHEYLGVSISLQNLVMIDAVVFII